MVALPAMTVTFDDGTVITIEPKPRDMARAEILGYDFTTEGTPFGKTNAVALAVLQRMDRAGSLPEGLTVPTTLDELLDMADVEGIDEDEDPEGKD